MDKTDDTLRVEVGDGYVMTSSFDPLFDHHDGLFETVDELPNDVQQKIALLLMHKQVGVPLSGIGTRISDNVFWINLGENEGGNNTRSKSKKESGGTTKSSWMLLLLSCHGWLW